MTFFADIFAATFRNATPLVYGTVGETYTGNNQWCADDGWLDNRVLRR